MLRACDLPRYPLDPSIDGRCVTMCASRSRVRRAEVTETEWIEHRKLRKKIASAKWYAKKKRAEIEEEHRVRAELAVKCIPPPEAPVWSDPVVFAHWHAGLDYQLRGFPLRPSSVCVVDWVRGTRTIHAWLSDRLPRTGERGCDGVRIPWTTSPRFARVWRRLAMGEWCDALRSGSEWTGWTCSVVGAAFAAWHIQQSRLSFAWGAVARAMNQVVTVSTMRVHNQAHPVPHNQPPNQNPTKNADRVDMDPLQSVRNWHDWVRWMNQYLFDPLGTSDDETPPDDTHSLNMRDGESFDWMDDHLSPFRVCEEQPSSLDPLSESVASQILNDILFPSDDTRGDYDHRQPCPGATHSPDDEPTCWISDPNSLPSISGSVDLEDLDPGNPINPW